MFATKVGILHLDLFKEPARIGVSPCIVAFLGGMYGAAELGFVLILQTGKLLNYVIHFFHSIFKLI